MLGVTSSTGAIGVAVGDGSGILASRQASTDRRHAEELTPMLQLVLAEANVAVADLEAVAVDVGPGRFTGLRVGLATAKALAIGLDLPMVGVTSLELLSHSVITSAVTTSAVVTNDPLVHDASAGGGAAGRGVVAAVIDARRQEVFLQPFADGVPLAPAAVGPIAELVSMIPSGATVLGDGVDRYRDALAERHDVAVVHGVEPSPEVLVALAQDRGQVAPADIAAAYLRDPDVQINIKTRDT